MEMHTFRQHLREAIVSTTQAVKGVRKPKGYKTTAAKTLETLRKEVTYNGVAYMGYTVVGHDLPTPANLSAWGLPPTKDTKTLRGYMPLLWWADARGQIKVWEMAPDQTATIHYEIPEFEADLRPGQNMADYQGRVDRFRKTISIMSGGGSSVMRNRFLQKGKGRIANTLARMFPGYTIVDMDNEEEL
jgi:hypothetical protein